MFRVFLAMSFLLCVSEVLAQEGQFYIGGAATGGLVLSPNYLQEGFAFGAPEAFAGLNLDAGNVFVGIEADLYGHLTNDVLQSDSSHVDFTSSFTRQGQSGSGTSPFGDPGTPGTHHVSYSGDPEDIKFDSVFSDAVRTRFGGTASVRSGVNSGDTKFYGRVGAGLAQIHRLSTVSITNLRVCDVVGIDVTNGPGGYTTQYTGCEQSSSAADRVTVNADMTTISPTIVVGAGVEQSWDHLFARGEATMTHAFYSDETAETFPHYTPIRAGLTKFSVTLGGGVRF